MTTEQKKPEWKLHAKVWIVMAWAVFAYVFAKYAILNPNYWNLSILTHVFYAALIFYSAYLSRKAWKKL